MVTTPRLFAALLALAGSVAAYTACTASSTITSNCVMGWATQSSSGIVSGGTGGTVYTVTTRAQFVAALTASPTKKIIYVKGTLYGEQLSNGTLAGANYYRQKPTANKFYHDLYLTSFDSTAMAKLKTSNPTNYQLALKAASYIPTFLKNQKAQIQMQIPSHTSIIGVGSNAKLLGFWLQIYQADNVVIRNLEIEAPRDLSTQWDPSDGFNAEFDGITIEKSTRVWIDHCTLNDGRYPDSSAGTFSGKTIQYHDGMIDVKAASDYITISHCIVEDHDKTSLFGSSDSATGDAGHLRITLYGNKYSGTTQRTPRVRYGKIHILNNYYVEGDDTVYFIGLGKSSSVLSEYNAFVSSSSSTILKYFKGTLFKDVGSSWNGVSASSTINALAKKVIGSSYSSTLGWTVPYAYPATLLTKSVIEANAGVGKLTSYTRSTLDEFFGLEGVSNCTVTKNCSSTSNCGAHWDGCMMISCGKTFDGATCNGTNLVGPAVFSDYELSQYLSTNFTNSSLPEHPASGEWSTGKDKWNFSSTEANLTALDGGDHLVAYNGSQTYLMSNITSAVSIVKAKSGTVGIGLPLGSTSNDRVHWKIDVSTKSASVCIIIDGAENCTQVSSGISYNKNGDNNVTVYLSYGESNSTTKLWVNGKSSGNITFDKNWTKPSANVYISASGSSTCSFANLSISSKTQIVANTTTCHTEEEWSNLVSNITGLNVETRAVGSKCSTRKRSVGFTAFETLIPDAASAGTPSSAMAEAFTSTAIDQGVAAAQGFEIASITYAAPSVMFGAELTAEAAVAVAAASSGLSAGAIAAIAACSAVGGVAVVGGATTAIVVAAKKGKKDEETPKEKPVRMELKKPAEGVDVMNAKGGEVHSSITARSAPVAM